jgi:uncharacterized protein YycO
MTHAAQPEVLLFRGRGFISGAIRWQTRSVYSHAALLTPEGRIVEAWQGAGVRVTDIEDWEGIDRFVIPSMTPEQGRIAVNFALSQVGMEYDYWSVLRFVSRRSLPGNVKWFCSELVFAALRHAGVKLLDRIEPGEVSPGMLALSPLLKSPTDYP